MNGASPKKSQSSQPQALFEKLFEFSPDAIVVTNQDGRITNANAQLERAFGYTREELLDQPVEILIPERFHGVHPKHRSDYSHEPRVRHMGTGLELYGRRKDGSEFPVDIKLSPVETPEGRITLSVIRDISERKRTEGVLRKDEELLRQLTDNIREVFFLMDLRKQQMLYVSPAYEDMWGRSCQSLYESPMSWFEAIHPDDQRRIAPAIEKFLAEGVFEEEYRITRPDGAVRWIFDRAFPIKDSSGAIQSTVGIAEDITRHKNAEDALRRNEHQLRSIVDNITDYAIFLLDNQGYISTWNPGAERIKGYKAEEIIGRHFSCLFAPEDIERGKPQEGLRVAASLGRYEEERWRVRKDGSRFWANGIITAIRDQDSQLLGFLAITRDFTDRKKSEEALLLELSKALVSSLDIRDLLTAFSAGIQHVVPHDYATLALYDPEIDGFHVQALKVGETSRWSGSERILPFKDSVAGQVFTNREPLLLNSFDTQRFAPDTFQPLVAEGLKSGCWLPLISRDQVIGTLVVASCRETAFTQQDFEMLAQMANRVATVVDNAFAFRQIKELNNRLSQENRYLEEELHTEYSFENIIGESPRLKRVLHQVETVAPMDVTILILGETGTGKDLIARAIHELSPRHERTFVKLNCAAIPSGLLESELFGHEKGAFTGAISRQIGRLELAHQGTLFLDEIGDLPLELQPKILRALQEKEFERLGSTQTIPVNVRLVAATNRDLTKMVMDKEFRSDLYYRLRVFPITLPPLRERREDIPLLVNYFVDKLSRQMNRKIETIPSDVMRALRSWDWPGNIRELENFIERAVILTKGPVLRAPLGELEFPEHVAPPDSPTLEATEREHILHVLRETKGKIAGPDGAAARLGLARTTLNSKLKKLGIKRQDYI